MSSNVALRAVGCALALSICGGAAEGAPPSRDWSKHPVVVEVDTTEDVYAIGDPHGDPQRLAKVLMAAKLIESLPDKPSEVKWANGRRSVLVITGDLIDKGSCAIDKGPDAKDKGLCSIDVITLLHALQIDAAKQGGQVVITMGNHEAEFLATPLGGKTADFRDELKQAGMNPQDVADCSGDPDVSEDGGAKDLSSKDISRFMCNLPIAARVNNWFFAHAGNTKGRTIDKLSQDIVEGFKKDGFNTTELAGGADSILEARLHAVAPKRGPPIPPWFEANNMQPKALLRQYADGLKVDHIVQGHQYGNAKFAQGEKRAKDSFFQVYGLLFLMDTGMSAGITSASAGGALHISGAGHDQQVGVICPDSKDGKDDKILWSAAGPTDHAEWLCHR